MFSLFMCAYSCTYAQNYDAIDRLDAESKRLLRQENYREALDSTLLLLQFLDSTTWTDMEAEACSNAAICYKEIGEYDKAKDFYLRSIALAEGSDRDRNIYHYTNFLLLVGGYQKAIDMLTEISGAEYEFQKLLNLSNAYFRRGDDGDVDKALSLLNEYITTHSPNDSNYPTALQNKGYIYWHIGRQDSAKIHLHEALSLLPEDKRDHYITLANLAVVEAELRDFRRALKDIDRVIEWQARNPEMGKDHPDYIISLRKKAEILLMMGKREEALNVFRTYFSKEREKMVSTFKEKGENEYLLNYWCAKKPLISEVFQLEDTDPTFLYNVALFRRQMALLGNGITDISREVDVNVSQLLRALKPTQAAIEFTCYYDNTLQDTVYSALIACPGSATKYVRIGTKSGLHQYNLTNGTPLEDAVCSSITNDKNVIYSDSTLAQMIWQPIFTALPANVSKLYFAPDGMLQMLGIENLPYERLKEKEVHRLTSTANLLHPTSPSTLETSLIIGGVDYNNVAEAKESGDGEENNHLAYDYMKDECGIDVASGVFAYLKGSETEADSIMKKVPNATDGNDGRSSEEYIKKHLADYALVHLSTHGYSLKVNIGRLPASQCDSATVDHSLLSSGIALQGANVAGNKGEREDGLLSARELCDIDNLSNIDLFVLSACQTAQGVVSDEGPAGVVRGLKKAGVHTIVASLWPVSDAATALFMNAFYDALLNPTNTKLDALRKAQDTVRDYTAPGSSVRFSPRTLSHRPVDSEMEEEKVKKFKPYKDPYYWAPFILIDDI